MTVQNKMAVLMMSGGLGELGAAAEKAATSKTAKTDSFKEVFRTADRSYAETDMVETGKDIAVEQNTTENVEFNEREQLLKRVFEKVISDEKEVFVENEIVVTDEVIALLQSLIQTVSEQLQEILEVSEEELNEAADKLGMTKIDLLDAGKVTELVVSIKADGDFTELISDGELHEQLTSVLSMLDEEIAEVARELGVTTEQFGQLLDAALVADEVVDDVAPVKETTESTVTVTERTDMQEDTPIITVDKPENHEMSQNDTTQNEATQDNSTLFGEVISNLEKSVAATELADEPQAVQIVRQVIEQIQVRAREDLTSMELQLTPENLGKVNLQVIAKDGAITAQIATETLVAKEAIEAQINVLRENLNEQGIKVEAVEVTVESHKFEANSEQNKDEKQGESGETRRRFINLDNVEEGQFEDTAAVLAREIMMSNGNRMDIIT